MGPGMTRLHASERKSRARAWTRREFGLVRTEATGRPTSSSFGLDASGAKEAHGKAPGDLSYQ
jgi:hypothetical protein